MKVAPRVAAVLLISFALFFLLDERTESSSSLLSSSDPVAQPKPFEKLVPQAVIERATATQEQLLDSAASTAAAPEMPTTEEQKLATMKGRFLLPDGSPGVGVRVILRAFTVGSDQLRNHGLAKDWKDQEGETDARGCFKFFFDPPQDYEFRVEAKLAGYAQASWRWSSLPRRETTDLGTTTLPAAGRIQGKLTDKIGQPLHGEWSVHADSSYRTSGSGGDTTRACTRADPETGAFVLEDLPAGSAELKAQSRQAEWVAGPTVEVGAGETVEANIVYEGLDNRRRITVVTFCRPLYVFDDEVESVVLHGAAAGPITAEKHGTQSFTFDDLDPGLEYTVEIRGPKVQSFTKGGLRPGNSYNAILVGSAAVALEVVDGESGEEVGDYRLRLRYRNVGFSPNEFEIRERGAEAPEHGLYRIVPGDVTLIVEGKGSKFAVIDLDAVATDETRSAVARLASGVTLVGRVVQAGKGEPVRGMTVHLWPAVDPSVKDGPLKLARQRNELRQREELCKETITDVGGAFLFAGLTPGFFVLTIRQGDFVRATRVVQVSIADQQPVILELPNPGFIDGRLTGISERALASLVVHLECVAIRNEPESDSDSRVWGRERTESGLGLDSNGCFRFGPLAAGSYQLSIRGPGGKVRRGSWSSVNLNGIELRFAKVEVRAGEEIYVKKDLATKSPGFVNVSARREEGTLQPAADVVVTVQRIEEEPRFRFFAPRESERTGAAGGQTDANGKLVLGPIFPGEWEVMAETVDESWFLNPPGRITIPPAGEVSIELRVQVFEHELEVVDADGGEPCGKKTFMVEIRRRYSMGFATDDRGRLKLRLAPGKYALWERVENDFNDRNSLMEPRPEPKRYEFEWTAAGPVPATLWVTPEPK
jgi:hypothetical protein